MEEEQQLHSQLHNTHVKLLAFDLLSLSLSQTSSSSSSSFSRRGISLSSAEALGIITSRDHKPYKFLRFTLDDGTGCVNCVLWLNHLSSPHVTRHHTPLDASLIAASAARFADLVHLGKLARVRGKISYFRGAVQITVSDVVIERDPNAEILHWLECINLARKCYNALPATPS
ncbi:CST complex subunit STN1 [Senna tora]|uniref:CST complex subunit STN1 n=1 Tax=Senna tora TaxID=362788 RepID=A0A834SXA6_9FABA|nr:CST complex subunit STN1 [Senna tora]